MNTPIFTCAMVLIALGFYCFIAKRNLLKLIIGFNLLSSGIILLLVRLGDSPQAVPPVLKLHPLPEGVTYADPLPQALALTCIVIGAGITALALSLTIKLYGHYKTLNVSEIARRASE